MIDTDTHHSHYRSSSGWYCRCESGYSWLHLWIAQPIIPTWKAPFGNNGIPTIIQPRHVFSRRPMIFSLSIQNASNLITLRCLFPSHEGSIHSSFFFFLYQPTLSLSCAHAEMLACFSTRFCCILLIPSSNYMAISRHGGSRPGTSETFIAVCGGHWMTAGEIECSTFFQLFNCSCSKRFISD